MTFREIYVENSYELQNSSTDDFPLRGVIWSFGDGTLSAFVLLQEVEREPDISDWFELATIDMA